MVTSQALDNVCEQLVQGRTQQFASISEVLVSHGITATYVRCDGNVYINFLEISFCS